MRSAPHVTEEPRPAAPCRDHRPLDLGYIAWHREAERRGRRGMKQRRCPDCLRWFWHDEWGSHGGWDAAERESVA